MRANSKYYLDQAEQCRRSAKRAATPELRSQWDTLAEGWLSLIPGEVVQQPELYLAASHQNRSHTPR
jgi:hypothetical protein